MTPRPSIAAVLLILCAAAAMLRADRVLILRSDGTYTESQVVPATSPATAPTTGPTTVPSTLPTQPTTSASVYFVSKGDNPQPVIDGARDGDTILFERGGVWRALLTVRAAVVIGSFGEGAKPVILAPVNAPSLYVNSTLASLTIRDLVCRPADPTQPRGEGLAIYGNVGTVLVDGVEADGFEQCAVFVGGHGAVTLRNCWFHDAWADTSKAGKQFRGQALYLQIPATSTPTVIDHCILSNAGTANGRHPEPYQHDTYDQHDGPGLIATDSIFAGAAAGGLQVRSGGSATRCVFYDCGVAILASGKPFAVKDSLIVGGHRYGTGNGQTAGNMGVCAYSTVTLDNVRFLGVPGQGSTNAAKDFDMGCLMASRTYPPAENPATAAANAWAKGGYPGRVMFAGPVVARGWPGPTVSGDAAPKVPDANLTVRGDQPPLAWLAQFRADIAAGRATAGQALKAQGLTN